MNTDILDQAKQLARDHHYEAALALFREAGGTWGFYGAGACLHKLNRIGEAREALHRALDLDPSNLKAAKLLSTIPKRGETSQANSQPSETLGIIALCLPIGATLLIWFWIGQMNLLQSPGSTLNLLVVGTIIATDILIAVEASRLGFGRDPDLKETSPVTWLIALILLWFIIYPMYFFKRRLHGARNMLAGAIVVTLVFILSWAAMATAIQEKTNTVTGAIENILAPFRPVSTNPSREGSSQPSKSRTVSPSAVSIPSPSRPCWNCKGTGWDDCPICVNGRDDCSYCSNGWARDYRSGAQIICEHCRGLGYSSCTFCNGAGGTRCTICNGTGKR